MKRQIKTRVEKQNLNRYLENVGSVIFKNLKELKAAVSDFETGIPLPGWINI